MISLFIDTNVYLTFYHLSDDDIEELKKLDVAIANKEIELFITQQVEDEFKRNREGKIADAINIVKNYKLPGAYPRLLQGYDEYKKLRQAEKDYRTNLDALLVRVNEDVVSSSLAADELINNLMRHAIKLAADDVVFNKAKRRMDLGNPPGKDGSLGDAINWESLLANYNTERQLHLISQDSDYKSKVNSNELSQFLKEEWSDSKPHDIIFHKSLSSFFKHKFPGIKLADELAKEISVNNFISSSNFSRTHFAVARLSLLTDFSDEQALNMCKAAVDNGQICGISEDKDINDFVLKLVNRHFSILPDELVDSIAKAYSFHRKESKPVEPINLDDIPF